MNHEQEALDRYNAGQYEAAQFHATMYAAQQQRLTALIALWSVNEEDAVVLTKGGIAFGAVFDEVRKGLAL